MQRNKGRAPYSALSQQPRRRKCPSCGSPPNLTPMSLCLSESDCVTLKSFIGSLLWARLGWSQWTDADAISDGMLTRTHLHARPAAFSGRHSAAQKKYEGFSFSSRCQRRVFCLNCNWNRALPNAQLSSSDPPSFFFGQKCKKLKLNGGSYSTHAHCPSSSTKACMASFVRQHKGNS